MTVTTNSQSHERILIVEDERIVACDLSETLTDLGYAVVGMVGTGEEAIGKAKELQPDLILMDIHLAGAIDGIEASTTIQRERGVPIIYLTAHSDNETLRRAGDTGPLAYLVKPFNARDLKCSIEIALRRNEIDARLRDREHWLRTTMMALGDAVVATDNNENVVLLNPVAEALTGWSHKEAVGKEVSRIVRRVQETTSKTMGSPVSAALRTKQVTSLTDDAALIDRAGRVIPIDDTAAPILDDDGSVLGGVIVFRDVTERRRNESEVRRQNAELEQSAVERTQQLEAANTELEAFSYSVAHDLQAPLRGIEGFSRALVEDHVANLGPEALSHLNRIRSSVKRMGQLIEDLLRLARVARKDLNPRTVDLSKLARGIAAELQSLERDRVVEFHADEGISVLGDEQLLRIVLENLLRNAWKFTSKTPHARVTFGREERDGASVCVVRDNGAGFDETYAGKLFGAFQRLHPDGEFEGTGVGLAIVQRIIHRHGGRVWAHGSVARGAAFYFVVNSAPCPDEFRAP